MGRTNIPEIVVACKSALDDTLHRYGTGMVVFCLCLVLFGLLRLSVVEAPPSAVPVSVNGLSAHGDDYLPGGSIVASRSKGTYFYPWCTGASKIRSDDQEVFPDENAAVEAGYIPGRGCNGLEVR